MTLTGRNSRLEVPSLQFSHKFVCTVTALNWTLITLGLLMRCTGKDGRSLLTLLSITNSKLETKYFNDCILSTLVN